MGSFGGFGQSIASELTGSLGHGLELSLNTLFLAFFG
jgi:hypothetical protein